MCAVGWLALVLLAPALGGAFRCASPAMGECTVCIDCCADLSRAACNACVEGRCAPASVAQAPPPSRPAPAHQEPEPNRTPATTRILILGVVVAVGCCLAKRCENGHDDESDDDESDEENSGGDYSPLTSSDSDSDASPGTRPRKNRRVEGKKKQSGNGGGKKQSGSGRTSARRQHTATVTELVQAERRRADVARRLTEEQRREEADAHAELDGLVHTYSVTEPPPASVRRVGGAAVDPFAADRRFFRNVAPGAAVAPELQAPGANVLDQGRSGTCTRYALAGAIRDTINARIEALPRHVRTIHMTQLDGHGQQGIVHSLMEHSDNAAGAHPDAFDGMQIKVKDTAGCWYRVDISITQNATMNRRALEGEDTLDRSKERFTNVICYNTDTTGHSRHCIYLDDCDINAEVWIGTNSWGDRDQDQPHPRIDMHSNVSIYDVRVTSCVLLKGSDNQTANKVLWGRDRVQRPDDAARRETDRLREKLDAEKLARQQSKERAEEKRLADKKRFAKEKKQLAEQEKKRAQQAKEAAEAAEREAERRLAAEKKKVKQADQRIAAERQAKEAAQREKRRAEQRVAAERAAKLAAEARAQTSKEVRKWQPAQQTLAQQRQQAAAEQRERERAAKAAGTKPDGQKLWDAAEANDVALVLELLRQGAELEWRNHGRNGHGYTPLAIACREGSYAAAEALCAHGAQLDTREESFENTPLIHAAFWGCAKICEMLLALGADPSLKNNEGETALDLARKLNHPECVALLQPVTPGS